MDNKVRILNISLPQYSIDQKPDYSLGQRIDEIIKGNFDVENIVVRAISSSDHPQFSLDELVQTIIKLGTDKYNPNRKGVEAEANQVRQQSLTPEILQQRAIEKWDGRFPTYFSGGALPFITISSTGTR